jgi:ATP-dependent Clp protease ATP-binding subunit ClpB
MPCAGGPFSVILFDEIEKAHQDVFNSLLQILDDGRLTDSQGRTVDFRNTVIIMTSNLGSEIIMEAGEKGEAGMEQARAQIMSRVRTFFRPEFLNRVDEIVIFHPLNREHLQKIVEIQADRLLKRLQDQHITLELTAEAKQHLAAAGYDPVYGARPLKRAIQKELETPLAQQLLEGRFKEGDRVIVSAGEDRPELHKARGKHLAPQYRYQKALHAGS